MASRPPSWRVALPIVGVAGALAAWAVLWPRSQPPSAAPPPTTARAPLASPSPAPEAVRPQPSVDDLLAIDPDAVPARFGFVPASDYDAYRRTLEGFGKPYDEYNEILGADTPEQRDEITWRHIEGVVAAARGASGCARKARVALTRRRIALIAETGELLSPLPVEVKLQVVADGAYAAWPPGDWRADVQQAASELGADLDHLGDVAACLPP